jgi:hypothetical protein
MADVILMIAEGSSSDEEAAEVEEMCEYGNGKCE